MKVELLREGVMGSDNRLIEPGAVKWGPGSYPVMWTPPDSWDTKVIGKVTRVWREDDSIWCEWDKEPKWLSVDATSMKYSLDNYETPSDRIMRITSMKIYALSALAVDAFLWPNRQIIE